MTAPLLVGGYRLDRILAKGGMSEVWLAHKEGLGGFSKEVVVKRMLPHLVADKAFMELFLKEARVAALFSHPNLVPIIELGESDGSFFIAMEYVRGCTLRALQQACFSCGVGLPLAVLCRILFDACAGLEHAHDLKNLKGRPLQMVHLDVSPENLLISVEGVTKVSDFGVASARERTDAGQSAKQLLGKAVYIAPEHAAGGPVDRRADIYSLGAMLFEFVAGEVPLASGLRTGDRVGQPAINFAPVTEVAPGLEPVLRSALAIDPDRRQATARIFSQQMTEALGPPAPYQAVAKVLDDLLPAVGPRPGTPTVGAPGRPRASDRESSDAEPGAALESDREPTPSRTPTPPRRGREAEVSTEPGLGPAEAFHQTVDEISLATEPGPARPRRRRSSPLLLAVGCCFLSLCLLLGRSWWQTRERVEVLFRHGAGGALIVDGVEIDAAQPLSLSPGRHRLEVVGGISQPSFGRWFEVTAGAEQQEVEVTRP